MALILNIETSTAVCSAALTDGDEILFEQHSFEGPSHASLLGVYVEKAMQWTKEQGRQIEAVAVSSGPGSYTGLRIGVSVAKGLCFGAGIPLISVPTLSLLAATALRKMGPIVTAMSAEASDMSSWLLMGLPGLAYLTGICDPGWTAIGLGIGTWLNWFFVARKLAVICESYIWRIDNQFLVITATWNCENSFL